MQFTKFGRFRLILGIVLLLGLAIFTYVQDYVGLGAWYTAGFMVFLLFADAIWALASLRRPYLSAIVQIIFLPTLYYLGEEILGGLVTLLTPLLVLTTAWCVADFFRYRKSASIQLSILNVVLFLAGFAGIVILLDLHWSLESPVG